MLKRLMVTLVVVLCSISVGGRVLADALDDASARYQKAEQIFVDGSNLQTTDDKLFEYTINNIDKLSDELSIYIKSVSAESKKSSLIPLITELNYIKAQYSEIKIASLSKNTAGYNYALSNINSAVDRVQVKAMKAKKSSDQKAYVYGSLMGFFSAISAGLFIWSKKSGNAPSDESEQAKNLANQARKNLFLTTLAPLAGAAVTFGWYMAIRSKGGTYPVLYGPVIIGLVYLFSGIKQYRATLKGGGFQAVADNRQAFLDNVQTNNGRYESVADYRLSKVFAKNLKSTNVFADVNNRLLRVTGSDGATLAEVAFDQIKRAVLNPQDGRSLTINAKPVTMFVLLVSQQDAQQLVNLRELLQAK
jgi:hypothetical protein